MKSKRTVNGVFLLDKPNGMTSNEALQRVKRLFGAKKAGHTGSLDPIAVGMLPICFGEATKFSQFLLDANKTYQVKAKLGVRTASGDSEGEIIAERNVPKITRREIEKTLAMFRGTIEQVPSMYSALKYQGQPLYKLARQGIEVERKARPVTIYELTLLEYNEDCVTLYVYCSKGTYVRTLIDDFGEALGCGAHVNALRRMTVSHYPTDQMITLLQLEHERDEKNIAALDRYLLPIESMVFNFPSIKLEQTTHFYLCQGQAVMVPHSPTEGLVRLHDCYDRFVGIGEVLGDGKIAPRRLVKVNAK